MNYKFSRNRNGVAAFYSAARELLPKNSNLNPDKLIKPNLYNKAAWNYKHFVPTGLIIPVTVTRFGCLSQACARANEVECGEIARGSCCPMRLRRREPASRHSRCADNARVCR